MILQTCTGCQEEQPIDNFHFHNKATGHRFARCKSCRSTHGKKYYSSNKETVAKNGLARRIAYKEVNFKNLIEYFSAHPCVDCGENDFRVLQFDHREAFTSTKTRKIGNMIHHTAWPILLQEIEKCDVRCANCHIKRTIIQLGWYGWAKGKNILPGF